MEQYRQQCVAEGRLLGKFPRFYYASETSYPIMFCVSIEAEEAQAKIEELRD